MFLETTFVPRPGWAGRHFPPARIGCPAMCKEKLKTRLESCKKANRALDRGENALLGIEGVEKALALESPPDIILFETAKRIKLYEDELGPLLKQLKANRSPQTSVQPSLTTGGPTASPVNPSQGKKDATPNPSQGSSQKALAGDVLNATESNNVYAYLGLSQVGKVRMMLAHQAYRQKWQAHDPGVLDLKWSDALAKQAQTWAEFLVVNKCQGQLHSTSHVSGRRILKDVNANCEYLENIFEGSGVNDPPANPEYIVEGWYSEIYGVGYGSTKPSGGLGHFFSMISRQLRAIGVGAAKSRITGVEAWVCQYGLAGGTSPHPDKAYIDWDVIPSGSFRNWQVEMEDRARAEARKAGQSFVKRF